jgi:hypothetical protein
MADQSTKKILKTQPRAGMHAYRIANGVTLYEGQLVQLESGYLNHWDETGQFLGILIGGASRANDGVIIGETSDAIPPEGYVDESGLILMHVAVGGTPTIADVGALVWCADSDTANLTKTDTTDPPVGRLVRFRSVTDCDVQLFTPTEWLAGDAGTAWAS